MERPPICAGRAAERRLILPAGAANGKGLAWPRARARSAARSAPRPAGRRSRRPCARRSTARPSPSARSAASRTWPPPSPASSGTLDAPDARLPAHHLRRRPRPRRGRASPPTRRQVTRQMLLNFLGGNAAANVFARSVGAALRVVDAGVAGPPVAHPDLLSRRIGAGTAQRPRRAGDDRRGARPGARRSAASSARDGAWDAVAFGEMGIGNTSAAALVAHKVGRPAARPRWSGAAPASTTPASPASARCSPRAAARTAAAPRRRGGARRVRRLRDGDDGRRHARRRRGAAGSSSSTASSPAPPRSPRSASTPPSAPAPRLRPPLGRARPRAPSSRRSAPPRSSTSACASARAPARSSPGRWCAPPPPC